jgi:3-oxoacyl-[acyl-carrier-protein] synthase-3
MAAYISGISYYLPSAILTSDDLNKEHPEWSIEKIVKKTGINQRHISEAEELASDMAIKALDLFFKEYSIQKDEIDFLLFCTQSPDYLLPTTACILQNKANLPKTCGALDFNLGCSGYIYGLGLAKGLIESQQAKNVLLVTAETYSKYIHSKDKSNRTLFGDAATVTLITFIPNKQYYYAQIGNFKYGTDGSRFDCLIVRNSGLRGKNATATDEYDTDGNFIKNDNNLYMDGKAIFDFTAFEIPLLVNQTLQENMIDFQNIDLFIFHQANAFMLDFVRNRCKIPKEKFYISIEDIGNTVSSTIPIALKRAYSEKVINENTRNVLLVGFGVGLSMGAALIKFNKEE